jgi:hypothetical protein
MIKWRTSRYCGETPRTSTSFATPPPKLTRSCISSIGDDAETAGTCVSTARSSSIVSRSLRYSPTLPEEPPEYSTSTIFGPMFSSSFIAYCLPVSPMVATRISEAEPITMPSAVSAKRTLFSRKLSIASSAISRSRMVRLALSSVC